MGGRGGMKNYFGLILYRTEVAYSKEDLFLYKNIFLQHTKWQNILPW